MITEIQKQWFDRKVFVTVSARAWRNGEAAHSCSCSLLCAETHPASLGIYWALAAGDRCTSENLESETIGDSSVTGVYDRLELMGYFSYS
jgi:hypothetical protein